jgi:tetratricopeptide (TPR) repeat protein
MAMATRVRSGLPREGEDEADAGAPRITGPGRIAVIAGAVLAAAFAVVSLVPPWIAARDVEIAGRSWSSNPEPSLERLDRAADLNFLSADPELAKGAIALRLGDRETAEEAFTAALEREPVSWYGQLELGAIDSLEGRRDDAVGHLEEAAALNPTDPLIAASLRRVSRGERLSPERIDRELLDRVCARVGTTDETSYCE